MLHDYPKSVSCHHTINMSIFYHIYTPVGAQRSLQLWLLAHSLQVCLSQAGHGRAQHPLTASQGQQPGHDYLHKVTTKGTRTWHIRRVADATGCNVAPFCFKLCMIWTTCMFIMCLAWVSIDLSAQINKHFVDSDGTSQASGVSMQTCNMCFGASPTRLEDHNML